MPFVSINPYTEEPISEFEPHTSGQINQKLSNSQAAFQRWSGFSFRERSDFLMHLAQVIDQHSEELALAMVLEMGKTLIEARAEVKKSAYGIRYFVEHAEGWLQIKSGIAESNRYQIVPSPLGGVLLVMPWNFPLWQVLRAAVPALLAGNVILLKHAPNVFGYSRLIEGLFIEAGFPVGVFENFIVGVDRLAEMVAHPAVAAASLTGSEAAGRSFAALCGSNLKKCVLELGGSDPFIVLPDADLDFAAHMAAQARMINNGQSCIAAKRFLVPESIESDFLELFAAKLSYYRPENPADPATLLGPMARADLKSNLQIQLDQALAFGAELVSVSSLPLPEKGYFFQPVVIRNVLPGNPCFDQEVFGPIAAVCTYKSDEEAISLANATRYGLGASIYGSESHAARLAPFIQCGTLNINGMVRSKPALPFGGIKASGYGKELGEAGLMEFINLKTIVYS